MPSVYFSRWENKLRSLVFLQQIGHVFQTDAQCGGIVQQRGYCGRQYPRYAQGDQRQVEGHDKPVAAVDPIHQRFTELTQRHQLKEILRGNGDVGDLSGDGRAGGDGNAGIRLGEGGRIVDAVPHHDNGVSLFLFLTDKGGLVLR